MSNKKKSKPIIIKGIDLISNSAGKLNRNDDGVKSGTGVWEDKSKFSKKKRRQEKNDLNSKINKKDYDH